MKKTTEKDRRIENIETLFRHYLSQWTQINGITMPIHEYHALFEQSVKKFMDKVKVQLKPF